MVVRLRGGVNAPHRVERTLRQLNLPKLFSATIVPPTPSYIGMLKTAKDYIAWCEADAPLIEKILEKRGRVEGWRPITSEHLNKLGFKNFRELAEALVECKTQLNRLNGVKPFFTLHPPRKGFKRSLRRPYSDGGTLGENPELPSIVERMLEMM